MSCRATKNTLGILEFLLAMKGLTFALFLEWLRVAPQGNSLLILPLYGSILNKNTKERILHSVSRNRKTFNNLKQVSATSHVCT